MSSLQLPTVTNELLLNTPNRQQILKAGPPANAKFNLLGRGAYGTVFKATFKAQKVAVKVIKVNNAQNLQSLRGEAHVLGWKHQNIVGISKIETTASFGIVIMERFTGSCLQFILDRMELPLGHRLLITLDIVSALSYCHAQSLLHLDVKPQNVLISLKSHNSNRIASQRKYISKLCDFGSSMLMGDLDENENSGAVRGTLRYMAPEVLREEPLTPAADIYALGISMWQMQQRQLPFNWLECNDAVVYQVVKHNLRPDQNSAKETIATSISAQCYCQTNYDYVDQMPQKELLKAATLQRKRSPLKPYNVHVVRNLQREWALKADAKCSLFQSDSLEASDVMKIKSIFLVSRNVSKAQESSFTQLYKRCWQASAHQRPTTAELRKSLKRLLSL